MKIDHEFDEEPTKCRNQRDMRMILENSFNTCTAINYSLMSSFLYHFRYEIKFDPSLKQIERINCLHLQEELPRANDTYLQGTLQKQFIKEERKRKQKRKQKNKLLKESVTIGYLPSASDCQTDEELSFSTQLTIGMNFSQEEDRGKAQCSFSKFHTGRMIEEKHGAQFQILQWQSASPDVTQFTKLSE